ncbi:MAG: hypothetical protein AAGI70_04535 [Pseudomonadota bacterium]
MNLDPYLQTLFMLGFAAMPVVLWLAFALNRKLDNAKPGDSEQD